MAQLHTTFNVADVPEDDGFQPVPAGTYRAQIVWSDIVPTAAGDDMLKLRWQIDGGPFDGRAVYQNVNMYHSKPNVAEIGQRQFAEIGRAVGKLAVSDSEELHHIPMVIRVIVKDSPNYGPQNEVKRVTAVDNAAQLQLHPAPAQVARQSGFQGQPAQQSSPPPARPSGGLPWQ